MSCNCNHTGDEHPFPCLCDSFIHPPGLNIGMGLSDIPRQIASFPEYRRAMLYAIRPESISDQIKHALDNWKGRQPDDNGLMLIDMWAYICDSLSFYDKVIAQEEYLRTAQRRPSLRRLVALLGYLPRPAVGSIAYLAAQAEGRLKVKIPSGTSFRSSGFNGNPPQVFETTEDVFIHPLTNKWTVNAPLRISLQADPEFLLLFPAIEIKTQFPFLLRDAGADKYSQVLRISDVEKFTGSDNKSYRKLVLVNKASLPPNYPLSNLHLYMPLRSAGLWTLSGGSISGDKKTLILDGLHREIRTNQYIIVSDGSLWRWFKVTAVADETRDQPAQNIFINNIKFAMPGVSTLVTRVSLELPLLEPGISLIKGQNWISDPAKFSVYFDFQSAGTLAMEPKTTLASTDPIKFKERSETPVDQFNPTHFFLSDKNGMGAKVNALLDVGKSMLQQVSGNWNPEMILPVQAFGNIIGVSRGESVEQEILGSGDATVANQVFKLKKKPLTYFPAPSVANDQGVENTLRVYVNGVRWKEVPGFFNKGKDAQIYIVRQDDEGDSFVTFGDGIRGMRLPTGVDNVIGYYRYGAESPTPPPSTINQIGKPVTDLSSVSNPLAAEGGDDQEGPEGLRKYAPKSILTLGRIVSIQDIDAVTRTVAGVRNVQVEWRWYGERQCPVVHIWFIGKPGIEQAIITRVRAISDPSLMIHVEMATAVNVTMIPGIQVDPAYIQANVEKAVDSFLFNKDSGLLIPETLGIGQALFRSRIFKGILSIEGVHAVRSISWNNTPFTTFAKVPGAGKFFDFENSRIQSQ